MGVPFNLREFAKALIQGNEETIRNFEASEDLARKMISGEISIDGLKVFGINVGKAENFENVLRGGSSAISCSFDSGPDSTYMADLYYSKDNKEWVWGFASLGPRPDQ